MTTLHEGSNYHQTRRHYATDMGPSKYYDGLEGHALCSSTGLTTEIYDQAAQNDMGVRYASFGHKVKQVSELPLCKRCERSAAKRGLEVAK
ncbi:hypothetical protein ACWEF6_02895 [Amycolatopsis sp. NPDC004772]